MAEIGFQKMYCLFFIQKIYILPQHLHKQFPELVAQNIIVLVVSNYNFMHVQFIQTMKLIQCIVGFLLTKLASFIKKSDENNTTHTQEKTKTKSTITNV